MKTTAFALILLVAAIFSAAPKKAVTVAGQPPRSAGRVDYSQPEITKKSQPAITLAGQPPRSAGRVD